MNPPVYCAKQQSTLSKRKDADMTEIGKIIQSVLESSTGAYLGDRLPARLAAECEQKLLAATMAQVAALLGGSLESDDEGCAVICTNIQNFCE
jgi:hypothetical protein